jgi:dihydroorotate dehydrogenase
MYAGLVRPILFTLPPGVSHAAIFAALGPVEHVPPLRALVRAIAQPPSDSRLVVRTMGLDFPSPIGLAAGFDKNALRPRALAALGFGHLELGTVTASAQKANPHPNLFRLPADRALVNRLGFPNDGAKVVADRLRAVRAQVSVPVGISIGKSRAVPADDFDAVIADYVQAFDCVCDVADFVVVNVSSPNTPGLRGLQGPEYARTLLTALVGRVRRDGQSKRILLKIAPDLDDEKLEELLCVVDEIGIAGVIATNTTVTRTGLVTDPKLIAAVGGGGLSGPPLRARATQMVRRIRARLGPGFAIIGVGGVEDAQHALALMRAGANLVQIYTGLIYVGPAAPARIARDLLRAMEEERAENLVGLVASQPRC